MTTTAMDRVTKARSGLVLDHPWFGVLSLRLQIVEQEGLGTMRTDGTKLWFDPAAIESWSDAELGGVIAHEVMHCALRHMYRTGSRNMKTWNKACDLAINPLLLQTGFKLPEGALHDPQFKNMSAEAIYAKLQDEQQKEAEKKREQEQEDEGDADDEQPGDDSDPGDAGDADEGDEDGEGEAPSPTGEFTTPGQGEDEGEGEGESQDPMTETDWEVAVEQATAVGAKRGHVSGDLHRAVVSNRQSASDWREILREFAQQVIPSDYSWQRPNRRHIASGLYLPGVVKEGCPRLVCAIDTSGSINQELLDVFAAELDAVLHQCQPERIDVVYCDAMVRAEQSFTPDDELTASQLTPMGGGGTAFQPVFDHVARQDEAPAALIYLTDLDGDQPTEPDYPVLWVTPEWVTNKTAPFGRLVKLAR